VHADDDEQSSSSRSSSSGIKCNINDESSKVKQPEVRREAAVIVVFQRSFQRPAIINHEF
jgi:hypothetical protein